MIKKRKERGLEFKLAMWECEMDIMRELIKSLVYLEADATNFFDRSNFSNMISLLM